MIKQPFFQRPLLCLLMASMVVVLTAPLFGLTFLNPFDESNHFVLIEMRIPRVLTAWIVGAVLSISGMCFQAILRNPLAEPFTLGVASGGALGASLYVFSGVSLHFWIFPGISLCAFLGTMSVTVLIYIVAFREVHNRLKLLLMGVILSFFCASLIMLLQAIGNANSTIEIVRWMMGRISLVSYSELFQLAIISLLGMAIIVLYTPQLNVLSQGHMVALTRGINPRRTLSILFLTVSFMLGNVIAICGPIGFVGLVVPHICRQIFGNDHRQLWLAVVALGGMILVLADTLATIILRPSELPVGVVTSLIGAPFFLWILLRKNEMK